jgi:DNA-directed RNA polymerase subunit RPC12/RpoP
VEGEAVRLHALGNSKPCPYCTARALAYQHEAGGASDIYRCTDCGRLVAHRAVDYMNLQGACLLVGLSSSPASHVEEKCS